MLLAAETSGLKRRLEQLSAYPRPLPDQEYRFLVGRFIDSATLKRATTIAARWGVHPHEVLIANGWLDAEDYYRALAAACGTSFKSRLAPAEVAPAAGAGPRRSLASGLLKERARAAQTKWLLARLTAVGSRRDLPPIRHNLCSRSGRGSRLAPSR